MVARAGSGIATASIERAIDQVLPTRRWFQAKSQVVAAVRSVGSIPLEGRADGLHLAVVEASYTQGSSERYITLFGPAPRAEVRAPARPHLGPTLDPGGCELVELGDDPRVALILLDATVSKRRLRSADLELARCSTARLRALARSSPDAARLGGEQTNTCWSIGTTADAVVCKLVRKVQPGPSLEIEVLEHLRRARCRPAVPKVLGHIVLQQRGEAPATMALFQELVPNQGDAWRSALAAVHRYFEAALQGTAPRAPQLPATRGLFAQAAEHLPPATDRLMAGFPELARRLGRSTGELHLALACGLPGSGFETQTLSARAFRSIVQSVLELAGRSLTLLQQRLPALPGQATELGRRLLARQGRVHETVGAWPTQARYGKRIRVHGDLHLGQVLCLGHGKDFGFIDFDGEPARAPGERRRKRSPLADVAGMVRSFHYAAYAVLGALVPGSKMSAKQRALLGPWARAWVLWAASRFVAGYLEVEGIRRLLPESVAELDALLDAHLLEKALYELGYELDNRPSWVAIPLRGVIELVDGALLSRRGGAR